MLWLINQYAILESALSIANKTKDNRSAEKKKNKKQKTIGDNHVVFLLCVVPLLFCFGRQPFWLPLPIVSVVHCPREFLRNPIGTYYIVYTSKDIIMIVFLSIIDFWVVVVFWCVCKYRCLAIVSIDTQVKHNFSCIAPSNVHLDLFFSNFPRLLFVVVESQNLYETGGGDKTFHFKDTSKWCRNTVKNIVQSLRFALLWMMMAVVFNRWSSAMQMIGFPPSLFEQKKTSFMVCVDMVMWLEVILQRLFFFSE